MFTLGGALPCSLPGEGGPLPCSLLGVSTSMFTSGGGSHVTYPIMLLYTTIECPSASWVKFTWENSHVCVHFWGGVPCDLSHNALTYCCRTPQCIMGTIHIRPPPPTQSLTDWLTNTSESITFPHTTYAGGKNCYAHLKKHSLCFILSQYLEE